MRSRIAPNHPLRKLFRGLVEQAFMAELGICEVRLTAYLSDMLVDFVHIDQIYRMRTVDGEAIRDLSQVAAHAHLGTCVDETERRRMVNRYIGDFTLFWAGIYPENLHLRRDGIDRLGAYVVQGKRSYGIAGELSSESIEPPASLLQRLSSEFECCVHGLQLVREGWGEVQSQLPSD